MNKTKCSMENKVDTYKEMEKIRPMQALFLILLKCSKCQKPCEILNRGKLNNENA